MEEFRYLEIILRQADDDTHTITKQMENATQSCNGITRRLKREGANVITMANFYMAMVQSVLLHGADFWPTNDRK